MVERIIKLSKRAEQVLALIHTWPREFLAEGSAHVLPGCGTHRPSGSDKNIALTPTEWAQVPQPTHSKAHRALRGGGFEGHQLIEPLEGAQETFTLHQATLAQQLGCSRWTIGRAIKRLKEVGLLVETGRDKQSRCKTYALQAPSPQGEREITPQGQVQLQNYRRTFELNFIHWPDWEKHYAAVTWELKDVHCIHKLFRQTFDRLYEIRDAATPKFDNQTDL